MSSRTVSDLRSWSCQNNELPPVSLVKAIHVYDFDNTLFKSPLPNPRLWGSKTIVSFHEPDYFANGGWWHDPSILEATGQGSEKEEPRAWQGWWNEQIVELVHLSMLQKDVLTVLLTGRSESGFADIIRRMVISKKLIFDMICLKPAPGPNQERVSRTMEYKQTLLHDLVYTYRDAVEIKVYEDRPKHTRAFQQFFNALRVRRPITSEVIQVPDERTYLNSITEIARIQQMVNSHNIAVHLDNRRLRNHKQLQIKEKILFTCYQLSDADSTNLLTLLPPDLYNSKDLKLFANNIHITLRPAPRSIIDKVGGYGARQIWQVNGMGAFEDKIWAVRVTPIPPSATYYTENPVPIIVLALRRGAKPMDASRIQNWQPVANEKQIIFETTVREISQLGLVGELGEDEPDGLLGPARGFNFGNSRRRTHADDLDESRYGKIGNGNEENRRNNQNGNYRGGNQTRGRGGGGGGGGGGGHHRNPPYQIRGGRGGLRGTGGASGSGRGRGKGGYKSLDDVGDTSRYGQSHGYQSNLPNYDDAPVYSGGDGYHTSFPHLSGAALDRNGNGPYGDGIGLPYGR